MVPRMPVTGTADVAALPFTAKRMGGAVLTADVAALPYLVLRWVAIGICRYRWN